jgi:ATP-dependent RNA helicase DeaD
MDEGLRKPRREVEPAADLPAVPDGGYAFEDDGQQITWRLAVGHRHGAIPGHIVGAIANEARLAGPQINGVDVRANYTLVRLPAQLPKAVIERLSKVRIRGQALALAAAAASHGGRPKAHRGKQPHRKGGKRQH